MRNAITVINSITNNGGDALVDTNGMLNITGAPSIVANQITNIQRIPSQAEQIQKDMIIVGTAQNNYVYTLQIAGYSLSSGMARTATISWTSGASNTIALTCTALAAAVNALTDFNVTATDGTTYVAFAGHAGTTACPYAPVYTLTSADTTYLPVSAPLTVAFSAAPTGGRTAKGYVLVPDSGTLSTVVNACIIVTDPGEGYTTAPTFTFAGGEGASAAATAYLFNGSVSGVKASAGSSYDTRIGIVAVGTTAAVQAKYDYPSVAGATPYPILSTCGAGYTYTEWVISYNDVVIGGNTTFSEPTATKQVSILVYEGDTTVTTTGSCANLLTLNSYWGTLANLKLGYKVNIIDSVASNTVTVATTGATVFIAGGSPALGAVSMGLKPGDILVVGTAAAVWADTTGVGSYVATTDNLNGFCQFTGSTITAASTTTTVYKAVKRTPISL